jgi:putative membrane protein
VDPAEPGRRDRTERRRLLARGDRRATLAYARVVRFVTWLLTTAAGVAVATWLFNGIYFTGPTTGSEEIRHKILPLLVVSLILGIVSSFVRPVVTFFSIPLVILTLGLFLLVINALMLMLTAWIAGGLGLGFHVDGFWNALGGSIVITIVNWGTASLVKERD